MYDGMKSQGGREEEEEEEEGEKRVDKEDKE